MLVVADSSALIALATCQALDVLLNLYTDVKVPRAVYDEVATQDKPMAVILSAFLTGRVESVDTSHWVLAVGDLGSDGIVQATFRRFPADR